MNPIYRIALNDCRFYGYHGVFPQERRVGTEYIVSLEVALPADDYLSDDLKDTVSYEDLYEIISRQMNTPRNLLEAVAGHIAEDIRNKFPKICNIKVTVTKVNPPIPDFEGGATVTLEI